MHADQRFSFVRPLRTGDMVIATLTIDKVRVRAGSELVSATVDISSTRRRAHLFLARHVPACP